MRLRTLAAVSLLILVGLGTSARCGDLTISTGPANNLMAMATRPPSNGKIEIEAGDDFILSERSQITNVSFTGLLTGGATTNDISQVVVEIYRVFPLDSTVPPSQASAAMASETWSCVPWLDPPTDGTNPPTSL